MYQFFYLKIYLNNNIININNMDNCIICLEDMNNDSFIHKYIKRCNCNYKIHTLCLFNYVSNNINNKKCMLFNM